MLRHDDWAQAIAPFLLENETIQWMGQPNPRRVLTRADLIIIPFLAIWLCFILPVFSNHGSANDLFAGIPLVFGVLVALSVVYWLAGRFVVEYFTRRNTLYVLTNQRALVRTGFVTDNVEAISLHAIATLYHTATSMWFRTSPQAMTLEEFADAPITLNLFVNPKRLETLAFVDIADADALYTLVESLRRASVGTPSTVISHVLPDPELAYVIEPLCEAGESVLWAGQPDRTKLLTDADWCLIPGALLWSGMLLTSMGKGMLHDDSISRILDIVPVLLGFYLLLGRFVLKYWRKRHIFYAVTDRHIIVLTTFWRPAVLRYPLATIPLVAERLFRDGTGTIRFGPIPPNVDAYDDTGLDLYPKRLSFREGQIAFESDEFPPTFHRIPEAHALALLINALVLRARMPVGKEVVE